MTPVPRSFNSILYRNGEQKFCVQNEATQPDGNPAARSCTSPCAGPCTVSLYLAAAGFAVGSDGPRQGASARVISGRSTLMTFYVRSLYPAYAMRSEMPTASSMSAEMTVSESQSGK
jgi:hypothetical protein